MKLKRSFVGIVLAGAAAQPLRAQADPDPGQPRPPLLLEASRTERLEAAVRMYLAEFIGAIQRADTVALASLVPDEVVPAIEKPVAARAGCTSLGAAIARLRAGRAGESQDPESPLSGVRIGDVVIVLGAAGDTAARVRARILERRGGKTRYAPIEVVFTETAGSWRAAAARGALVGVCGMSVTR